MKYDMIIGIDPDIDKSGFAIWCPEKKKFYKITTMSFFDVIFYITESLTFPLFVRIEAGWLINKSNWHKAQGQFRRERIAKNVGENHAVGKLFAQFCKIKRIEHELVKPLGKVDAKYFQAVTGWQNRTNQEMRDAAMLVYRFKQSYISDN